MMFSVNYHSKHKAIADEIKCPHNQLGILFNFIKDNPDKRYNILLPEEFEREEFDKLIEQIELLKEITTNYTIQCRKIQHLRALLDGDYNAYLGFPISDWESFQNLRKLNVSDIYIDGPLGFQMEALNKTKGNCKIRVSPTVSSNAAWSGDRPYNSFYIRPEDLQFYTAIDVIDFQEPNQDKEDALFSIYNRGTFNYNIDQLISGLPSFNNLIFKQDFGKQRANCGQVCNVPGHSCHQCNSYFKIIELLSSISGLSEYN